MIAAAAATPSESTPPRMGIRARMSAAACASGVSPGPSAPSSTAVLGWVTGSIDVRSTASAAGVSATVVYPAPCSRPRSAGQSDRTAYGSARMCPIETRTERR